MNKFMIIPTLLLTLSACATSPDYREARNDRAEGFSHQVIENNRYRVQYRLDEDHIGKAQDYALLRAAELTMEKGFQTFQVVSESANTSEGEQSRIGTSFERDYAVTRDCRILGCRTSARPAFTSNSVGTFTSRDETVISIEILLSADNAPASPDKYDASQVAANIRARLG